MIPRPKNTDTMDDVLKMQNDYLTQKNEENFQPAAATMKKSPEPKQSFYAKERNLKQPKSDDNEAKPSSSVIGDVVERKYDSSEVTDEKTENNEEDKGFPKPKLIDTEAFESKKGTSIFAQISKKDEAMDDDYNEAVLPPSHEEKFPNLDDMTHEEILEEQGKLLKTMDPKTIDYLRSKRKSNEPQQSSPRPTAPKVSKAEDLPALDFLKDEQAKNWLHFDILEPEKLEWTRNIEKTFANLKPGESYEARFDWKGFLLPFIDNEKEIVKDDRELYMHNDDPQRPGYSLQELLRLARSTVLQQRVAAINAIAGIINIYNQGFYDGILELPISKIFFFLRFAMDENTPAIVEVSSRALSYLVYNDTDEMLLDISYETRDGMIQPLLNNLKASIAGTEQEEAEHDLESSLRNLSLDENRKLFESKIEDLVEDLVDDNEEERESFNDFHMAEVNLVECLMRTNILERISYILTVTKPNDVTIQSCVKILIRLSRASRDFALRVLNKDNLIEQMIADFLPTVEGVKEPHFIVLKLFRVISSYDRSFFLKLKTLGVVDIAKGYVSSRKNVDVNLLKLQIESFRFLRLYFYLFTDEPSFKELIMPIRYLLNWHFHNLDFQRDNHFIIRQHASSLLYLLSCGNVVVTFPIFSESFKMCCSKWCAMATRDGAGEFSQKLLLSAIIDVATPFVTFSSGFFYDFVDDYLLKFLNSSHYKRMALELPKTSPLFRGGEDRCNIHKPLINLGSIVRRHKKSAPTLILSQDYSIYLMHSLFLFIYAFDNSSNTRNSDYYRNLCDNFFTESIEKYFEGFSGDFNRNLVSNWFIKTEINFVFNLLNSRSMQFNPWILKVAFNVLNCLTQENVSKIFHIFQKFVFIDRYYFSNDISPVEFERFKFIYRGLVMSNVKLDETINVAVAIRWNQILLNESWPYSLLLMLLYNVEVDASRKRIVETELTEEEIINTTLRFTHLLEKNKIRLIPMKEQLMYLMVVYLGKELNFLDVPIKQIISDKLKAMHRFPFPPRFNMKFNKEKSYESLYLMILDTFQSNGYCDDVFSVLVMVPLAQKYDAKWRKLVWSEYVATMKFVSCKESDLLEDFNEYLTPIETDPSLLKCYAQALSSNLLRKDSLPWKIAEHHVMNAKRV